MSSLTGFKVSRQRPRTNTSSLRTNGDGNHVLEAMRRSIHTSNAKARRTMKRKRSTSDIDANATVACQDDDEVRGAEEEEEAKCERKKKVKAKRRKDKKQKTKSGDNQTPTTSSSSSDESVLTAKKSAKHNKELYKVLSSSVPHDTAISGGNSKKKPTTIDEHDAANTRNNMEAFNQFIINEGTLMEKVSQEEALLSASEQLQYFQITHAFLVRGHAEPPQARVLRCYAHKRRRIRNVSVVVFLIIIFFGENEGKETSGELR